MNLLKIIASLIEEYECDASINIRRSYITFNLRAPRTKLDNYRLSIQGMDAKISRIIIKSRHSAGPNGRPYFVPEDRVLLSVDLYNPHSLDNIRGWLKTLR